MSGFNAPDSLIYTAPQLGGPTKSMNYLSYRPKDGTTFTEKDDITIDIAGNGGLLDLSRSYFRYNLKLVGGDTTTRTSVLGGTAILQDITFTMAGQPVETVRNYNQYLSILNKRSTQEYKNILKVQEGYGDTQAFSTTQALTFGRVVNHTLKTGFAECTQYIPLAYSKTIQMNGLLDNFNSLVTAVGSTTPATSYTVSEVEFVGCIQDPEQDYQRAMSNGLANGKALYFQQKLVHG
ncbi:hypothetical protein MIR68_002941, partial [Amoeboaphelidium protococcarum]